MEATDLRYPIGKAADQPYYNSEVGDIIAKDAFLQQIKECPTLLENAILNLDEAQLNTPYREGGWTIRQVVHHVADSHMNAFIRFKLGLTENSPIIKPYDEAAWAKLNDVELPVNISLTLLHPLHIRMYTLLKDLEKSDWDRTLFHPEHQRTMTLWDLLKTYSWHGRHHVAHITSLRDRMGWS